jgi:hypothetical protein
MSGRWWIRLDDTNDPPVYYDDALAETPDWTRVAATFGQFLMRRFVERSSAMPQLRSGHWLRTPDEPFQPPVIDFLIDRFGEPQRTPRPGNVTTYTWRPAGGTVRVTADEPTLTGALSAWWVHAETPERLAEFADLLLPWGTLRETLKADTDGAREVLQYVRGRAG